MRQVLRNLTQRRIFGFPLPLYIVVGVLAVLYASMSVIRHMHFESGAFDLGLFDQAVWQYSRFMYPFNTIKERMILGDHFTLTLPLLAPLYWIRNDVRMLLVFQVIFAVTAMFPIYAITLKRTGSMLAGYVMAILYAMFYGVQYGLFFDFHPIILGAALLPWLAWFLETGRKKTVWVTVVVALLTQENMGFALASLGFLYLFRRDFRKTAVVFIVLGIAYSLISVKIAALFSPVGYQYWPRIPMDPFAVAGRLFDAREKNIVWLYSYSWFSLLPLLSPGCVLAVLFDLSQYFVTGPDFARMWSPFMHHRAILSVFLALGTIDVLAFIRGKGMRIGYVAMALFVLAMIQQYAFHLPLNKLAKRSFIAEEQWMRDNRAIIAAVPDGVSVASQQSLVPHLSHRKEIYLVWPRARGVKGNPCGRDSCFWLEFSGKPEYLVVDTRPGQWLTQALETDEHFAEAVRTMEAMGKIVLQKRVGNAALYRIAYP